MSKNVIIELEDTTHSRILFGFMRKAFNAGSLGDGIEKLDFTRRFVDDKAVRCAFKNGRVNSRTNLNPEKVTKKNKSLILLPAEKSTVHINGEHVSLKTQSGKVNFEFLIKNKDLCKISSGIFTDCYFSWKNNRPLLIINKTSKRSLTKKYISEKEILKRFNTKAKHAIKAFSLKVRKAKRESKFKTDVETLHEIQSISAGIKFKLIEFIDQLNVKYSNTHLHIPFLDAGENQASALDRVKSGSLNIDKELFSYYSHLGLDKFELKYLHLIIFNKALNI